MPLNTEIIRNGKSLKVRWSDFHVAAMVIAVAIDSGEGPFEDAKGLKDEAHRLMESGAIGITPAQAFNLCTYGAISATPLNSKPYTLKTETLTFHDNSDGELFTLKPGDELHAYRN